MQVFVANRVPTLLANKGHQSSTLHTATYYLVTPITHFSLQFKCLLFTLPTLPSSTTLPFPSRLRQFYLHLGPF